MEIDIVDDITVSSLSPKGHDFLDKIKDPGIWKKAKEKLSMIGPVSINIVGQITSSVIAEVIKSKI